MGRAWKVIGALSVGALGTGLFLFSSPRVHSPEKALRNSIRQHYEPLTRGLPVTVNWVDERVGKGLFATQDIQEGTVIFEEAPLVSCQEQSNKQAVLACENCQRWLRFQALPSQPVALPLTPCGPNCRAVYCSDRCLHAAQVKGHGLLCLDKRSDNAPPPETIREFHSFIERNPRAQFLLLLLQRYSLEYAVGRSDAAPPPLPANAARVNADTPFLPQETLRSAFQQFFGQSNGLFTRIRADMASGEPSPSTSFLVDCHSRLEEMLKGTPAAGRITFDKFLFATAQHILNVQGSEPCTPIPPGAQLPPARALGMYELQATINHSCEPNVGYDVTLDSGLKVIALRDIRKGEQLLNSYVHADEDLPTRRALLEQYEFTCTCPRCTLEQAMISTPL